MSRLARLSCLFAGSVFALSLVGSSVYAAPPVILTDEELDQVYGGESFPLDSEGRGVAQANRCNECSINVTGSAQASASAIILVNAVGSVVSAQVNLIVRRNSPGPSTQTNVEFSTHAPAASR